MNPPNVALQPGSTNTAAVKQLQDYLVSINFMTPAQKASGYGTYGPQTTAAVLKLQQAKGVDNSTGPGYWGPKTIAAITSGTQSSVNSGKTPVLMSDGSTRYYDSTGAAFDANGAALPPLPSPISPTSIKSDNTQGDTHAAVDVGGVSPGTTLAGASTSRSTTTALLPQLVPGTPEYQAAMDSINTAYFDVMQQQMTAQNEQQQQAAQYNWENLKNYIETNLGVTLKADAVSAWDQIQNLNTQYGNLNLEGSGIQNEAIDDYLQKVRANDAAQRNVANTREDEQQMNYYQQYATPQQIKEFAAANPAKAQQWGLTPSATVLNALNPAALKAKYPTLSDPEIQSYIASVMDENNNYRSSLYQKYMTGSNVGVNAGQTGTPLMTNQQTDSSGKIIPGSGTISAVPVTPTDTGILDIQKAEQEYKQKNAPLQNPAAQTGAPIIVPKSQGTGTGNTSTTTITVPPGMGTTPEKPASTKAFTVLPNGNVQMKDTSTGQTTQGTADYMKTMGYNG